MIMTENPDAMQRLSAAASHTLALAHEILDDLERDALAFAQLRGGFWVVVADAHGRLSVGLMREREMVALAFETDGGGRVYRHRLPMDI
jgi:hypothetical protein